MKNSILLRNSTQVSHNIHVLDKQCTSLFSITQSYKAWCYVTKDSFNMVHTQGQNLSNHDRKQYLDIHETNKRPATGAAKSLQSCLTLCNPIDGSPPGSAVPGIHQARTLEWVSIPFSNAWKWKVKVKSLSHVWLFATPWTAAYQAPPSMGFSRQEYWSGVPLPSPNKCPTSIQITAKKATITLP